jgi:hypothetical protein
VKTRDEPQYVRPDFDTWGPFSGLSTGSATL